MEGAVEATDGAQWRIGQMKKRMENRERDNARTGGEKAKEKEEKMKKEKRRKRKRGKIKSKGKK